MEEGDVSAPDITDSVLQQPLRELWTSINHQCNNGEQHEEEEQEEEEEEEAGAWDRMERVSLSPDVGRESPEEEEEWEQIIWPVRPISCTSPQISVATVQWDFPDASAETDSHSANQAQHRDAGGVTDLESSSLSACQLLDAERLEQEDRVELDGLDSEPLNSDLNCEENKPELILDDPCCNLQPCDAADVHETEREEKEDSQHELLDSDKEISPTKAEEERELPGQTEDVVVTAEENQDEEDEDGRFADVKLEEEQEEPHFLLTEQRDAEEEQTPANSDEIEEENDEEGRGVEEKQGEIYVSCHEESGEPNADEALKAERITGELLQTEDTGQILVPDSPTDLLLEVNLHSDIQEDPTGHRDRLERCKDADQNVVLEEEHFTASRDEVLIQEAETAAETENSSELQMTFQDREDSEPGQLSVSEQCQMTEQESSAGPQEGEEHCGPSGPSAGTEPTRPQTAGRPQQTEPLKQNERRPLTAASPSERSAQSQKTNESHVTEQLSHAAEAERHREGAAAAGSEDGGVRALVVNGESPEPGMNAGQVEREKAGHLAERLFKLDGIQRADVVKHLDKDNDFSRAVGEEYLKFFDFTGLSLDGALRSFLKVVILIGETQERERVLQHFSCRFHQCNPDSFTSSGAVLALTCALMLLNTDLHGQNVGKSMSPSQFVSNLDGMNEEENFSKDLLKSVYNSIKSEPLEWAVDEEELKNTVLLDEDAGEDAPLRSKANPFQDVPHDKQAAVVKQGFLQRKLHANIDGKRTPWGKRSWKTFCGMLRGMVLYLQKDDYRRDQQSVEEVVSVHHSVAEQAADYNKKPHVFRLQTADWRVFLFQAPSKVEMNSWISRINLVSALHSSPPFPAAVGSQRRFCRPILPASQSTHTLEQQLQSHAGMLESFKADLSYHQENTPEGRKAKAKDLEEHRVRAEYLQHEVCRYEVYLQVLDAWGSVEKIGDGALSGADLNQFDKAVWADSVGEEEEEEEEEESGLKRSHSSPSLELETTPQPLVKVKRNISERRTYRRTIIPKRNKEV